MFVFSQIEAHKRTVMVLRILEVPWVLTGMKEWLFEEHRRWDPVCVFEVWGVKKRLMFCLNNVLKCLTRSVSVVAEFLECVFNLKTAQLIWEISFVIFI